MTTATATIETTTARDAFGARIGTQAAAINAVLFKMMRTGRKLEAAACAAEAGVTESRFRNHMLYLQRKELIDWNA